MRGWIPCPNPDCLDGFVAWRQPVDQLRVEPCPMCDGRLWVSDRRMSAIRLRPVPVALLLALAIVIACAGFLAGHVAAAPRSGSSAAHPASAQTGAPHVRGSLDPRKGIQTGEPSGGPVATDATTVGALDPRIGREGRLTHMGRGWPIGYLAIPLGPGVRVTICGPAACRDMVSTDAGPNHERLVDGVIADVSWQRFETLCGVSARMGGCPGSWTVVRRAAPTLPPTDVAP